MRKSSLISLNITRMSLLPLENYRKPTKVLVIVSRHIQSIINSQLTSIIKDDSLTRHQTYVKIHYLFVSYPRELRSLLYATRPLPPRRRPHEEEDREDYSDEITESTDGFGPLPTGLKFKGIGPVRVHTNRVEN